MAFTRVKKAHDLTKHTGTIITSLVGIMGVVLAFVESTRGDDAQPASSAVPGTVVRREYHTIPWHRSLVGTIAVFIEHVLKVFVGMLLVFGIVAIAVTGHIMMATVLIVSLLLISLWLAQHIHAKRFHATHRKAQP